MTVAGQSVCLSRAAVRRHVINYLLEVLST